MKLPKVTLLFLVFTAIAYGKPVDDDPAPGIY